MRRFRFLLLVLGVVALSACRLDVTVDMTVNPDGTGDIVVVATVDADVVGQVPGLAGSLQLDDAVASGWVVEGPTATEEGGLSVTVRHPFASIAEARLLLAALSPPLAGAALDQEVTEDAITTTLTGSLTMPATWDGYGDAALVQAIGGTPFGAQLSASGADPGESAGIELRFTAPGADDPYVVAAGGGVTVDIDAREVLEAGGGSAWAGPAATGALVLLGVWLIGGALLASRVWRAQQRRHYRHR